MEKGVEVEEMVLEEAVMEKMEEEGKASEEAVLEKMEWV